MSIAAAGSGRGCSKERFNFVHVCILSQVRLAPADGALLKCALLARQSDHEIDGDRQGRASQQRSHRQTPTGLAPGTRFAPRAIATEIDPGPTVKENEPPCRQCPANSAVSIRPQ